MTDIENRKASGLPSSRLGGLHHVTAIASDPASNVAFYTDVLGQRLVKKTVNFDDPGTYHLYYGDGAGNPGSIMTFFPWPGARRGSIGAGQAQTTCYAVPRESLEYWQSRLAEHGVVYDEIGQRFGDRTLVLHDPDGLRLELIEGDVGVGGAEAWAGSEDDPIDRNHAIRGFHGVVLAQPEGAKTAAFLEEVLGFERVAEQQQTVRFRIAEKTSDSFAIGSFIDVATVSGYGQPGAGTVHHVAFRVADDETELEWRRYLTEAGYQVSPVMDRQYFHSIYFREPGGVLFEIATDPPGFAVDEPVESLGSELKLPPALESERSSIEARLPKLEKAEQGGETRRAS